MGKRFWHWFWGHPAYPKPLEGKSRCGCGTMLAPWRDDPNTAQSDGNPKNQDIDRVGWPKVEEEAT